MFLPNDCVQVVEFLLYCLKYRANGLKLEGGIEFKARRGSSRMAIPLADHSTVTRLYSRKMSSLAVMPGLIEARAIYFW
jgi:hypothetical protein